MSPQLVAIVTPFLAVGILTVALRCYVRIRLKHCFWMDDTLSVLSLLFFIIASIFIFLGVGSGAFEHDWMTLSDATIIQGLKFLFFYEISYAAGTILVKLSICVFLLRFTQERTHKWVIYAVFAILLSFGTFLLIFILVQCHPTSAFWERPYNIPHSCNREGAVKATYAHTAVNSFTDWTLGILPIFIVRKIHLNLRTRVYIGLVLGLGSCASIATLARFAYVKYIIDPKNLFYHTGLVIWSHLEIAIALIASSAATLRPLGAKLKSSRLWPWRRNESEHPLSSSPTEYLRRGSGSHAQAVTDAIDSEIEEV